MVCNHICNYIYDFIVSLTLTREPGSHKPFVAISQTVGIQYMPSVLTDLGSNDNGKKDLEYVYSKDSRRV